MIALSQYFVPPQYRKLSQCSWFEMVTIKPKCVNPLVSCDISFVLVQTFTTAALSKTGDNVPKLGILAKVYLFLLAKSFV